MDFSYIKEKQTAEIIIIGAIGDEFNGITNKNLHTAFF
jgi:hypothetical protein